LLYRLSISNHVNRFLLKGAQLMLIWIGESARSTRDADLLGFGDLSSAEIQRIIIDLCNQQAPDDGMEYLVNSIQIAPIREENAYGGRRIQLWAQLGSARLRLQIDVGIGDAVTPPPEWVVLPQILDLPAPRLRAYRPETSIAEKLETIVSRGLLNSRLKDYFDIYTLSLNVPFDLPVLLQAIKDTFERRGTPLPSGIPIGLTQAFVDEPGKALQWHGFLDKVGVKGNADDLIDIIESIAHFLRIVIEAARTKDTADKYWPPGGPWQLKKEK
ncbi:nucleotidyl transferase AbiEii/AbiGii toxin family protein, partial [Candidatus Bipolaricaulota bacterium]|nr:nucleotidyl transferase AbiEii/AbiGii toxin family protein [Candidatus Bipolaricaulota bacterium]